MKEGERKKERTGREGGKNRQAERQTDREMGEEKREERREGRVIRGREREAQKASETKPPRPQHTSSRSTLLFPLSSSTSAWSCLPLPTYLLGDIYAVTPIICSPSVSRA